MWALSMGVGVGVALADPFWEQASCVTDTDGHRAYLCSQDGIELQPELDLHSHEWERARHALTSLTRPGNCVEEAVARHGNGRFQACARVVVHAGGSIRARDWITEPEDPTFVRCLERVSRTWGPSDYEVSVDGRWCVRAASAYSEAGLERLRGGTPPPSALSVAPFEVHPAAWKLVVDGPGAQAMQAHVAERWDLVHRCWSDHAAMWGAEPVDIQLRSWSQDGALSGLWHRGSFLGHQHRVTYCALEALELPIEVQTDESGVSLDLVLEIRPR